MALHTSARGRHDTDEADPRANWHWPDLVLIGGIWAALLLAGTVALTLALQFQPGGQPGAEVTTSPLYAIGVMALQGLTLTAAVWLGLRRRGWRWSDLGLVRPSARWAAIAVGAGVGLRALMIPVALLMERLGVQSENAQRAVLVPGGEFSLLGLLSALLLVGVAAPIAEELFFRGVIYRYARGWGVATAILSSSLVFALIHLNLVVGLNALLLGVVTALVYERSGSLWAAAIVHVVFNALAVVMLYLTLVPGLGLS
jgi:membrane protease YdiL (CAAX protease family)